eukprot:m.385736 g.385736  ORF g.385736 m.385736 type:complete len:65 (+) comp28278_c0_seq1:3692-3886(+)
MDLPFAPGNRSAVDCGALRQLFKNGKGSEALGRLAACFEIVSEMKMTASESPNLLKVQRRAMTV